MTTISVTGQPQQVYGTGVFYGYSKPLKHVKAPPEITEASGQFLLIAEYYDYDNTEHKVVGMYPALSMAYSAYEPLKKKYDYATIYEHDGTAMHPFAVYATREVKWEGKKADVTRWWFK